MFRKWFLKRRHDGRQAAVPAAHPPGASREAGTDSRLSRLVVACLAVLARCQARLNPFRPWLLAAAHLVGFVAVFWGGFLVRFDFDVPDVYLRVFKACLPWVLLVKLVVFYAAGHFHGWWRHVTFADFVSIGRAVLWSTVVLLLLDTVIDSFHIPRGVLVIDAGLTLVAVGSARASWRLLREYYLQPVAPENARYALLVGTDYANGILAHQIHAHPEIGFRIVGFVAIDGQGDGRRLGGIPVLGRLDEIAAVARRHLCTHILVTAGSVVGARLRELMVLCEIEKLQLQIIPPPEERFRGERLVPIRSVEINDLLHREPIRLDETSIRQLVRDEVVLVTGAGGSIGSEICRQLLRFHPKTLVLLGRGENRIFVLDRELQRARTATKLCTCIADVTDTERMAQVFSEYRPGLVFHAAAHKHVPLMEANPGEAIKNNIFGTKCVADLSDRFGVKHFVLISTDKAVNPTSVMGATKHLAERYVNALSQDSDTRFTVVRFGNVLGSAGSVVPIFQDQIRRGGPVTITDPRMVRYFMTIPEAVQLVLQAAAMGKGGEIFVLDMGEPVKIVDLARDLIRLSGLPADSIEIVFSGLRPGEKLYEELYFDDEKMLPTAHPKVRVSGHRPIGVRDTHQFMRLLQGLINASPEVVVEGLSNIIPGYAGDLRRRCTSVVKVE